MALLETLATEKAMLLDHLILAAMLSLVIVCVLYIVRSLKALHDQQKRITQRHERIAQATARQRKNAKRSERPEKPERTER